MLFTGVVWAPGYAMLFRPLAAKGIRFSVLAHDVVLLEDPGYVSDAHRAMFTEWLLTTLALGDAIFVSSAENRDRLLCWAALAAPASLAGQSVCAPATKRVHAGGFVLSVGTINRRKSRAALCRLWPRPHAALPDQAPRLVLAGRDDVGPEALSDEVAALIEAGDILALQGVADAELAGPYDACLFTALPSPSEGYGLPVAEGLAHGKLRVASDLAVIRDHDGDLPCYVPPGDEAAPLDALQRAITDTPASLRGGEAHRAPPRAAGPGGNLARDARRLDAPAAVPLSACGVASARPDLPDIAPPIPARAKDNVLICRFPFPLEADDVRAARDAAGPCRLVISYSEFGRAHVLAGPSAHQVLSWPVKVVHPPVPQYAGDAGCTRRMVLTVGRFFLGAHNKRHDLMIDAFRRLLERAGLELELHIAESSTPVPAQVECLARLRRQAAGEAPRQHLKRPVGSALPRCGPLLACDRPRRAARRASGCGRAFRHHGAGSGVGRLHAAGLQCRRSAGGRVARRGRDAVQHA